MHIVTKGIHFIVLDAPLPDPLLSPDVNAHIERSQDACHFTIILLFKRAFVSLSFLFFFLFAQEVEDEIQI